MPVNAAYTSLDADTVVNDITILVIKPLFVRMIGSIVPPAPAKSLNQNCLDGSCEKSGICFTEVGTVVSGGTWAALMNPVSTFPVSDKKPGLGLFFFYSRI